MTGLVESVSSVTELKGEIVHSLIAWDLPVVGGPTKIEQMLRGISCVAVMSVDVEPMKAVVVIRLVET